MQLKLRLYRKICEDQSYHDNLCIIKSVRSVRSVWPIKILRFSCVSQDFCVSLQCRRTMIIYVSKSKILWSHGTRDTLLSEYQADVSLAEITRTSRLRPRLGAPVAAEAEVVPPRRGRQDLWISRPPLTASSALRLFSFLLPPSSKNIKTFYHSFGQPKLPVFRAFRVRSVSCL